ncbi:MAG TPA: hypothetical protein VIF08_06800 [Candidatus Limnocylindrales bacterium]
MLRGGLVVLLVPIFVLPTQVEVRLMLGGNLGSTGFSPALWTAVGGATIFSTGLVLVVLFALAWLEAATFALLASDPDLEIPVRVDPAARVRELFVVQSLTLIALLLAAVPLASALGQVTYDEILRPTSTGAIFDRVLAQVLLPLSLLAAALPIIDSVSAAATRRLLIGRSVGSAVSGSIGALVRRPIRFLATAAVAWLALAAVVVATETALGIAWQQTRAAFLRTTSIADMLASLAPLLVAVLLCGVFASGLAVCGYVAAFRNALWTITSLRR